VSATVEEAPVQGPVVYAECRECDVVLWTPEIARKHVDETMTPVEQEPVPEDEENQPGIRTIARAHGYIVINNTPDEMAEYRIRSIMEDALQRFCDEIDTAIQRGSVTEEQVSKYVRSFPDFDDAWFEWLEQDRT
jgi:hypothetical protein